MSVTCPKCRRVQYYQCGNPKCPDKNIPKKAKPQINLEHDAVQCPYCGFTAHMDYWEDRAMRLFNRPQEAKNV